VRKLAACGIVSLLLLAGCGGGTNLSSINQGSVPTITTLSPSGVPAGGQAFQLTVIGPNPGSNFEAGSVVRWNGSDRPTMSNGSVNGLVAQISASDVATAGTAAVTVFNPGPGGGISNALTFTITPGGDDPQSIAVDPAGKFAYVMDGGAGGNGGYVSMYTINSTTGALSSIGPPISSNGYGVDNGSGVYAGSVAVDPLGKFAYVTNSGDIWDYDDEADGTVAIYAVNASTGELTSIGTIATGISPTLISVHPSGKFAYVTNSGSNDVSMYTLDATTGALTFIGSIPAGIDPVSVAVDPAGKFAYVTNWTEYDTDGSVSMYTIDATTGELTPIGTIATEVAPTAIAIHPSGKFAYVTNSGSNSVSMYSIDSATGALTLIGTIGT
jgi:YVTN family beta-propeller protein